MGTAEASSETVQCRCMRGGQLLSCLTALLRKVSHARRVLPSAWLGRTYDAGSDMRHKVSRGALLDQELLCLLLSSPRQVISGK